MLLCLKECCPQLQNFPFSTADRVASGHMISTLWMCQLHSHWMGTCAQKILPVCWTPGTPGSRGMASKLWIQQTTEWAHGGWCVHWRDSGLLETLLSSVWHTTQLIWNLKATKQEPKGELNPCQRIQAKHKAMNRSKKKVCALLGPQPPGEQTEDSLQGHHWQEMGKMQRLMVRRWLHKISFV